MSTDSLHPTESSPSGIPYTQHHYLSQTSDAAVSSASNISTLQPYLPAGHIAYAYNTSSQSESARLAYEDATHPTRHIDNSLGYSAPSLLEDDEVTGPAFAVPSLVEDLHNMSLTPAVWRISYWDLNPVFDFFIGLMPNIRADLHRSWKNLLVTWLEAAYTQGTPPPGVSRTSVSEISILHLRCTLDHRAKLDIYTRFIWTALLLESPCQYPVSLAGTCGPFNRLFV